MMLNVKRASSPIPVRVGSVEFFQINSSDWDWRDLYHRLLSFSWPRFAALLMGCYLAINLLFAGLFWLGGSDAIANMQSGSFSDAFFFSTETLATVGYGHLYPLSLYGHLVTTGEIVVGMFGMAVTAGLIFVRFGRPVANLMFSQKLVISRFDGVPMLMLRVANRRRLAMVEAKFRIMMIRTETTAEGEAIARFHELRLEVEGLIEFPAALTIRHPIDERSPLHGVTATELEREHARFVASVVCTDTVVPVAVQSRQHYTWRDVRFGERFVEIYSESPEHGGWLVDYGRLDDTEPLPWSKPGAT
jgi:inward rectifier potassium channel